MESKRKPLVPGRTILIDQLRENCVSNLDAGHGPLIGIWWDDGQTLVVLSHCWTKNAHGSELIDSNLEHWRSWERGVAARFGKLSTSEYFEIPRGRVMYRPSTQETVILHGSVTTADRLKVIAHAYHASSWIACRDDHYEIAFPDIDENLE